MSKRTRVVLGLFFTVVALGLTSCLSTKAQTHSEQPTTQKHDFPTESFVKVHKSLIDEACTDELAKNGECRQEAGLWDGSGASVANTEHGSYILTAAHVCHINDLDLKIFLMLSENIHAKTTVIDEQGLRHAAKVIDYDHSSDVCVMFSPTLDAPALEMASEYPEKGQVYYNMAAPMGVFNAGMVPTFDGYYVGDWKSSNKTRYDLYTIPGVGGSSGSPIMTADNKIIGLISMKFMRFDHIVISPKFVKIRNFVYDTIPNRETGT